jgi:hypothetical protein
LRIYFSLDAKHSPFGCVLGKATKGKTFHLSANATLQSKEGAEKQHAKAKLHHSQQQTSLLKNH